VAEAAAGPSGVAVVPKFLQQRQRRHLTDNVGDVMLDEDMKAELERLRKENESLKKGAARGVPSYRAVSLASTATSSLPLSRDSPGV
jgi:hypothetical protein